MRGIVLLEGADSSGKSTLARYLVVKHGAKYIHSTVRKDVWRFHVGALRLAIRCSQDRLVVLDRHWISELAYGRVFRGGPAYDVGARCLDRVLRRHGAIIVLCAPADQHRQEQRWSEGRTAGKFEHFPEVRQVIQLYADLRYGNLAHSGGGYLDQLIQFQDFTERDDVLVYDMDFHQGRRIATFEKILIKRLELVQKQVLSMRGDNLIGRGETLLVGEAPSPACASWAPRVPRWPWADRDDHLSAATWLNRAVHHLSSREDRLTFTNANGDGNYLPELLWKYKPRQVIALGDVAHQRIRRLGWITPVTKIEHPQHHRRFSYAAGPEGYAKILGKAMG